MFWVDEISSFQFALLDTAWDILTVSFFHIFILFSKSNSALHPLTFRRYGHMLRCSPHESVRLRSVFSFRSAQSFSRKAAAIYTPVTVRSVSAPLSSHLLAKGCAFRTIACPFRGRLDSIRQACTLHFHFITLLSTSIRFW